MNGPGAHSPVGASAIKRVLACPASVSLSRGIESEESEHASLGTAVHSVIEECFRRDIDAWGLVGSKTCEDYPISKDMADAAQVMLSAVRQAHPSRDDDNFFVERRFHCPTIHSLFFGTSDAVFIGDDELHIWDYKNGAGVIVEVEGNEQGMYYACGALEDLALWGAIKTVVIHIVQPNGFHSDGPVREWRTTPAHLAEWLEDVLVPGMVAAVSQEPEKEANSGEHCRFCPARSHACPQLMADMKELDDMMVTMGDKGAETLDNEQVGRFLALLDRAKIVGKAASTTAFRRIQAGGRIDGWKLAQSKTNRDWKDGAAAAAKEEFGPAAVTEPGMKSPAQIDALPMGTAFTARWAFKPEGGLTLVKGTDTRPEVSTDTKALFQPVAKALPALPTPIPSPARRMKRQAVTV